MKIISQQKLLEIGSAGLRCGRYIVLHEKDRGLKKREVFNYYRGKWYSYLFVLKLFGIVEFIDPTIIIDYPEFLHSFRKGKILVLNGRYIPHMLMDKKFFNQILDSDQPHQGKVITKQIRMLCPEII